MGENIKISSTGWWRGYSFPMTVPIHHCLKTHLKMCMCIYFWVLFHSIGLYAYLLSIILCFNLYILGILESRSMSSLNFVFFRFQDHRTDFSTFAVWAHHHDFSRGWIKSVKFFEYYKQLNIIFCLTNTGVYSLFVLEFVVMTKHYEK